MVARIMALVEPPAGIVDPGERRSVALLLRLLGLVILPAGGTAAAVQMLLVPGHEGTFWSVMVVLAGIAVALLVARAGHWRGAVAITVGLTMLGPYMAILSNPVEVFAYAYLLVSTLIAGIFLGERAALAVGGVHILVLAVVLPPLGYLPPSGDPVGASMMHGILTALVVLALRHARLLVADERQALEASELRYRTLMSEASDGILVCDHGGVIEEVNRRACEMLGYAPPELMGRRVSEFYAPNEPPTELQRVLGDGHLATRRRILTKAGAVLVIDATNTVVPGGKVNSSFRDVTERVAAEARIAHLATHDTVTNLPNRHEMMSRLEAAVRQGNPFALLFIDVDSFKLVNDGLGHEVGDQILLQIARRLGMLAEPGTVVARFGGDEFVILTAAPDGEWAMVLASRVQTAIRAPFVVHGADHHASASLGVALFPRDGADASTLLRHADAAMYRAKESGRNTVVVYAADIDTRTSRKVLLHNELRRAVDREEFFLHYQPQVCSRTGAVLAVEALVRWRHPERGVVPPGDFIAALEDTGLIVDAGAWVLRIACRQCAAWRAAGHTDLRLAVNVSPRQIRAVGFIDMVTSAIAVAGLPGSALEVEITESLLADHTPQTRAVLAALHALGVRIAIDDFGTGYSSLAYLRRFPVSVLKVDRSFVGELPGSTEDRKITETIVALARSLGLHTVAEGVETETQRGALVELGCEALQGFGICRPGDAATIEAWLAARSSDRGDAA